MNTEQKPDLRAVLASYGLTFNKSKKARCPFHEDRTPSLSIKGDLWKCFGCGEKGDVYSFVAQQEHLDIKADFPKIKRMAFEKAGEQMPGGTKGRKPAPARPAAITTTPTLDLGAARRTLADPWCGEPGRAYLEERGFRRETWERFGFGLCLEGRYRDRIIIPIGKDGYFTTRLIREPEPGEVKVLHAAGEIPALFNMTVLDAADSVFLTESPLDALTLIQTGYVNTVGLLGIGTARRFARAFKGKDVLLILDNDEPGRNARKAWGDELEGAGALVTQIYFDGGKDINEIYQKDPDGFKGRIRAALGQAERDKARRFGDVDYLENDFLKPEEKKEPIKTGFNRLDEKLGGGFYPGVIVLGGETSIGKTAMAVYWTIKAAEQKRRVLYLSYELSKKQMWARIFGTVIKSPFRDIHFDPDRGKKYEKEYTEKVQPLAEYIHVMENATFEGVSGFLENSRAAGFPFSLLVVDYIQRMPNLEGERSQERRIQITNLIHELQGDIARNHDLSVLALSSYSRGATATGGDPGMSYKESGDIEYTAQVSLSLWAADGLREQSEPTLTLKIWKNTIGETGETNLIYTKRTGAFRER